MEGDDSFKATPQIKRVKTVLETLWPDTNSGKPFQVGKSIGFKFGSSNYTAFWTKIS